MYDIENALPGVHQTVRLRFYSVIGSIVMSEKRLA